MHGHLHNRAWMLAMDCSNGASWALVNAYMCSSSTTDFPRCAHAQIRPPGLLFPMHDYPPFRSQSDTNPVRRGTWSSANIMHGDVVIQTEPATGAGLTER